MKDLLVIFVILLVLLTLISTFGGSINVAPAAARGTEFFQTDTYNLPPLARRPKTFVESFTPGSLASQVQAVAAAPVYPESEYRPLPTTPTGIVMPITAAAAATATATMPLPAAGLPTMPVTPLPAAALAATALPPMPAFPVVEEEVSGYIGEDPYEAGPAPF